MVRLPLSLPSPTQAKMPKKALELWGYESSPFTKVGTYMANRV